MKRRVFADDLAQLCPQGEMVVAQTLSSMEEESSKRRMSVMSNTASSGTGGNPMSLDEHHRGLLMMGSTPMGSHPGWPQSGIEVEGSVSELHLHHHERENTLQSLNAALVEPIEELAEMPLLCLEEAQAVLTSGLHVYRGTLAMPAETESLPEASFAEAVARTHRQVATSRSAQGLYALLPESATHPLQSVQAKQICGLGSPLV